MAKKYIEREKEYIEREAVLDALYDNEYTTLCPLDEVSSVIGDIPAADVVEVVRCRECMYWERGKDYCAYCNHWAGMLTETDADNFCSYGERRDD